MTRKNRSPEENARRANKDYFPEDPPARSTMQVGKFNGGMVIEIEAIATILEDADV